MAGMSHECIIKLIFTHYELYKIFFSIYCRASGKISLLPFKYDIKARKHNQSCNGNNNNGRQPLAGTKRGEVTKNYWKIIVFSFGCIRFVGRV